MTGSLSRDAEVYESTDALKADSQASVVERVEVLEVVQEISDVIWEIHGRGEFTKGSALHTSQIEGDRGAFGYWP